MRTIGGRAVAGVGMIALASLLATGCAEAVGDGDPVLADVDDGLGPQGKPAPGSANTTNPSVTMTCTQGTGGCVPTGYRSANCTISNLKPNTYVVPCVKAMCPSVYGFNNGKGESCFAPQKVALDGTAHAFFALVPDATYDFTTYSATKSGPSSTLVASASATLLSSVGEATQCGGQPSGSCM